MSIVVILKTHLWNERIENLAIKIMAETFPYGIDFFILMHSNDDIIYNKISNPIIKNITLKFTEDDIKSIYSKGFCNMWLSNHWILMWFYKKYGTYQYYWSIEYDVGIIGDSSIIWTYKSDMDFLYTRGGYNCPKNKYFNYYSGNKLSHKEKKQGFLQIARYSKNFLTYLDNNFANGENGQDELIIYSLVVKGNFTMSNTFLSSIIKGDWSWDEKYINRNKIWYDKLQHTIRFNKKPIVYILHPIK